MSLPCLRQVAAGVELSLFVQPRASRNQVVGLQGGELKVRLTAPPVEGEANKACCVYVAKLCGLSKGCVTLVSGDASRHKRLLLEGARLEEISALFENLAGA